MPQERDIEECQVAQIDAETEEGTIVGFWDKPGIRTDHRSRRSISEVLAILQRAAWRVTNHRHDLAGNRLAHLERQRKPGRTIDDALPDLDVIF